MWFVSRLRHVVKGTKITDVHDSAIFGDGTDVFSLQVYCEDTVTGKTVILWSEQLDDMLKFIREHDVVGAVYQKGAFQSQSLWYFVVISALSQKMMACVDSVEELVIPFDHPIAQVGGDRVGQYGHIFTRLLDGEHYLYLHNLPFVYREVPCTLLDIMCYRPEGWDGDEYNIFGRGMTKTKSVDGADGFTVQVFRVRFKDVKRARSLIAKAAVFDINPLRDVPRGGG